VTRWVWLGLRLSLGSGRWGLVRTALMGSGAALGCLVVLGCLGAVSVASAQLERAEARAPVYLPDDGTGNFAAMPGDLRVIEIDDAIGSRPLRRIAVGGASADSPRPPGISALPAPGEAILSPALARLVRTDDRARDRFPQRVTGTVGREGLVAPDELLAYVGVAADDADLASGRPPVTTFGGPIGEWFPYGQALTGPDVFTPGRATAAAFALFVLVPFGVFLATCARLSAAARDRRIAALRLLGVSARQAAWVNAVETGAVAACGAVLGTVLFLVLAPASQGWRIGRLHWYAADISVPPGWLALVLGATVGYAVVVGVLATRNALVDPLGVRRHAPPRAPRIWRLVPLSAGLGLAVLGANWSVAEPRTRFLLTVGGLLVTGLGLVPALPLLSHALAGAIRRLPRTPVWLDLATARLRHSPATAPRLVASIAVAVYVAGVALITTALVTGQGDQPGREPSDRDTVFNLTTSDPTVLAELRRAPGLQVIDVRSMPVTVGGVTRSVIVADCADYLGMHRLPVGESCVDGRSYLVEDPFQPAPRERFEAVTEEGVRIPSPTVTLHPEARHGISQGGIMLVTRDAPVLAGHGLPEAQSPMIVARDRASIEPAARLVSARTPAGHLDGYLGAHRGLDTDLLVTMLVAGLAVSVGLGIGSFAAASLDRTIERRRDNATLAVVGVRPGLLAACEVGAAALPLAVGLALATSSTVVVASAVAEVLELGQGVLLGWVAPILWLSLGALVVGLVLVAVPARLAQRITAEDLRRP
jgi:hypothetical protein